VLASLEQQRFKDFEVIVADDGSSKESSEGLNMLIKGSRLDFKYVRQDDRGFRKSKILNMAVMASDAEYLMFIDPDCVLHPRCIEEHARYRQNKTVIAGRRVDLSPGLSARLTPELIRNGWLWGKGRIPLLMEGLRDRTKHAENSVYIRNNLIRSMLNRKDKGILGSHFSLHRKDLMDVNGFDERFSRYGGEDTDLEYRLRRNGVRIKTVKFIAIQYHIYHPISKPDPAIMEVLQSNTHKRIAFTPYGIVRDDRPR
jgi:GT2 family glycosyltransferase